jgi:hypothetical protein
MATRKKADKPVGRANVKAKNYSFPEVEFLPKTKEEKRNIKDYVAKVQLQRLRHDVSMWRDAVNEAENAYYPHRVRMQRMFLDTIMSGHTLACANRRKDLSMLREYSFKNKAGEENEAMKELLDTVWFNKCVEYILDARLYGYSLIEFGDMVDSGFPDISIVRRANVSPDRLNVAAFIYSVTGEKFLESPYAEWCLYVSTSSDTGISNCGYGLLYYVAIYEIISRNILGFNTDAAELFGMPTRIGSTNKPDGEERDTFEQALRDMGSAGYILKDEADEVQLLEGKGNGQGYKIYPDLEKRLEAKISKLILGHSDALDSTPGKLGGAQGGEESPASAAMRDKQTADAKFIEAAVNGQLLPKLAALGIKIDLAYKFCYSNNAELEEKRRTEDANNKATAEVAEVMKKAGLKMDPKYFEERTGIKTEEFEEAEVEVEEKHNKMFSKELKNKLEALYGSE